MVLCEQICRLRRQRGLTQKEAARALGVTAPTVSKWERGTTLPDLGLLPPWPGRAWTCTPCGEASCGSWQPGKPGL